MTILIKELKRVACFIFFIWGLFCVLGGPFLILDKDFNNFLGIFLSVLMVITIYVAMFHSYLLDTIVEWGEGK